MISICIAVKNRSLVDVGDRVLRLLPNCIASIVDARRDDIAMEIVVADWDSDDMPLDGWIAAAAAPIPVRLVRMSGGFSRGAGLNTAARESRGDILLFTDADSLLSAALIERGAKICASGAAYFPILFSFDSSEHTSGWWREEGFGNCMMPRELFERSDAWPEYDVWGKEDDHFFAHISSLAPVVRERVPGFFHQWHPEDVLWKNRYSSRIGEIADEIERVPHARARLRELTRDDAVVIVVDEGRFGHQPLEGRHTFSFLDDDGEYAGPPLNDDAAIAELHRLQVKGATHMAFAWMAFWWLDYYTGLNAHLRARHRCILESDDLVVFELAPWSDIPT